MTRRAGVSRQRPGKTAGGPCRGFVLPIVIMLVVVVGLVSAVMLQRHVARAKTVQRQLQAYQKHHGVRSLQTVIEAWRKTSTAQPDQILEMLEPDGLALTVDPGDGTQISLYLAPGQGTMLRRVNGLREAERAAAERAVQALLEQTGGTTELFNRLTRAAGPVGVDPNQADPLVLAAIVRGVAGDSSEARRYADLLVERRQAEEPIGLQTLANIAQESGIETEVRSAMSRFFTVAPELFRFRIDMRGNTAASQGLLSRYEGLLQLGSPTQTGGNTFEAPTPFLTWEEVNPDNSPFVE